jgi:hypothetical protein
MRDLRPCNPNWSCYVLRGWCYSNILHPYLKKNLGQQLSVLTILFHHDSPFVQLVFNAMILNQRIFSNDRLGLRKRFCLK